VTPVRVPPETGGRNLVVRSLSAVILGPLVLAAVWWGGAVFVAMILVFAGLAADEWVRLVEPGRLGLGARLIAPMAVLACLGLQPLVGAAAALVGLMLATLGLALGAGRLGVTHRRLFPAVVPYIGMGSLALMILRAAPGSGLALVAYLLMAVWATDIGAFASGRCLGGPRLAPRFSPKKTWSGLLGGMVAAGLAGAATALAFGRHSGMVGGDMVGAALLAMVLAVVAQAGDLFESAIKRRYDVKDSGRLIPGHGGLLDRVDGLIAAAPVFALVHGMMGFPFGS
jgi:phosphatidate cytidylyltransferase